MGGEEHPRRHRWQQRKPFHLPRQGDDGDDRPRAAVAQVKGIELHGKRLKVLASGSASTRCSCPAAEPRWPSSCPGPATTSARPAARKPSTRRQGKDRLGDDPDDADAVGVGATATEVRDGNDTDYDVIIIGSGAAGPSPVTWPPPASGSSSSNAAAGLPCEIENWDADEVFVKNRYVSADTWYDERQGIPAGHPLLRRWADEVLRGLYRLRREDFGELRHHDGISPAWPISDDFEPWYSRAEHLYEVHGDHTEDPTEPRASTAYPFPAVRMSRIQQLSDDLERAGYHPFHAPCGIRLLGERHAEQHLHPLSDLRRLPVARPGQVR